MPIHTSVPIRCVDQESFHQVDRRVTGIGFEIHSEFGRYLDERLYRVELTRRCREAGLVVDPEMCITASFGEFKKCYFVDHLVNQGVVVESKAASALAPAHRGQTLNYLFMCGLHHATLLNFRSQRVQHEFVSTRLTPLERSQFEVDANGWQAISPRCDEFCQLTLDLLSDWGAYLDPALYREAVIYFFGGEEKVTSNVEIRSNGNTIGGQKLHLLSDVVAFSLTSFTHYPEVAFDHQRRFLRHTSLSAIQWVNLNHAKIEFRTIKS